MLGEVDRVIMCPLCLETMKTPILQCTIGHSMCGDCIKDGRVTRCPQCRGPLSKTRNYQLEQVIENMKTLKSPCIFADRGCKYLLDTEDKSGHEEECKYRKFLCEGRKFAKWKCEWFGNYADLEKHLVECHHSNMQYKMEMNLKIDLTKDFRDVQIISFFNGAQYFWYKFMVDPQQQKVYWAFQFIGTRKQASHYYYEFEIRNGLRKYKVTEICANDVVKAEDLFKEERCVALSFASVKTFLNPQGQLPIQFRIMTVKKNDKH